jgi:hypothetical protein
MLKIKKIRPQDRCSESIGGKLRMTDAELEAIVGKIAKLRIDTDLQRAAKLFIALGCTEQEFLDLVAEAYDAAMREVN